MRRQKIFLIRHARPKVSKKGFFSAADARTFISDYDAAEVEEFVLQHEAIPYKEVKQVYCSSLIRSQLTAKAIFGEDVELLVRHEFREFERRIFSLPLLRLPLRFWLLSARALWLLGFNSKGIETFLQARARARQGAELLAQEAEQKNTAILVAHGLLNNFIRRYLQQMGWKSTLHEGSGFLSVSVLEKPDTKQV
ncbi:histidine phosphatase family protein [Pontibacter roseus]|uniref:histidine phosphatase family protein n=1 Tax=Pontibacter roseus TaxID=336989 RepID=UPI0003A44B74|nr:histidine phosphatase family protein [Pontibacter roseus]